MIHNPKLITGPSASAHNLTVPQDCNERAPTTQRQLLDKHTEHYSNVQIHFVKYPLPPC